MLARLAGFTYLLRQAGVRVSPAETEDFIRAARLAGLDREQLETAALTTLAKGEHEKKVVQRLFNLYFHGSPGDVLTAPKCDPAAVLARPPRLEPGEFYARLDRLRSTLRLELARLRQQPGGGAGGAGPPGHAGVRRAQVGLAESCLRQALCSGDRAGMLALARTAVPAVLARAGESREGFAETLRRLKVSLDWAAVVEELSREDPGAVPGGRAEAVREMEAILIAELDRELWQRGRDNLPDIAGRGNLAGTDFSALNLEQVEAVKKAVLKMARSLATRPAYRRARSKKGEIDLRRTVRLAAQRGGTPLALCRRAKLPHRPELLVLCDLSGSVSLFTGFLLQLIYAVQDRFKAVRTFAFVDDVAEVTDFLKGREAGEAVARVLREARMARTPFSDYGAVWREFCHRYLPDVTRRTTILILGDARNNWKSPGLEHLEKLQARAARLIWLNPAPREDWDRDDSIISTYAPFCHRLFECRNLNQLENVARYLGRI